MRSVESNQLKGHCERWNHDREEVCELYQMTHFLIVAFLLLISDCGEIFFGVGFDVRVFGVDADAGGEVARFDFN